MIGALRRLVGGFFGRAELGRSRDLPGDAGTRPPPDSFAPLGACAARPVARPPDVVVRGVAIHADGCRPAALAEARRLCDEVLASPPTERRVAAGNVHLIVVPAGKRLTDLPEFAGLRGKRTFDGRRFEEVSGVAGHPSPDGRFLVAVPEENLAKLPGSDIDPRSCVTTHELGHVLHLVGLSDAESQEVFRAYASRCDARGPWVGLNSEIDEREYFADGVGCYFGRSPRGDGNGVAWLAGNDPALLKLVGRALGRSSTDAMPATAG